MTKRREVYFSLTRDKRRHILALLYEALVVHSFCTYYSTSKSKSLSNNDSAKCIYVVNQSLQNFLLPSTPNGGRVITRSITQ